MKVLHRLLAGTLSVLLLLSIPLFSGCSARRSSAEEKKTVLTVGNFSVPYELYRYVVLTLRADSEDGDPTVWDQLDEAARAAEEEDLRASAFAVLRQYYGILSLCAEYGITTDSSYIKEAAESTADSAEEEAGGEKEFLSSLREQYMTYNVYLFLQACSLCQDELYYAMLNDSHLAISEETLRAYFRSDEMIRIKQVLIDPEKYDSDDAALAAAERVRQEALDGADFDTLVNTWGNDLYMFRNTDGYYMMRGVRYAAFEEAAFALDVGEISSVVETPAGYSVLLRLEKEDAYLDTHFSDLKNDYYDARFSLAIEARAAALTLTPEEHLQKYAPLRMKME